MCLPEQVIDRCGARPDAASDFTEFAPQIACDPNTGCWLWAGRMSGNGYGQASGRRGKPAHRLSYESRHGPIPPGMVIMHRCDTPLCVNPAHLRVGTQADNVRDMYIKGRWCRARRREACAA